MHPRSKKWHLLDYVIVKQSNIQDVLITRVMRGADGWSDHRMIRSLLSMRICPSARKSAPVSKVNVAALSSAAKRQE